MDLKTGKPLRTNLSADIIMVKDKPGNIYDDIPLIIPHNNLKEIKERKLVFPLFSPEGFHEADDISKELNIIQVNPESDIRNLKDLIPGKVMIIFTFDPARERYAPDIFLYKLHQKNINLNVILNPVFNENDIEDLQIKAASLLGRFLTDNMIAGISVTNYGTIPSGDVTAMAFSILQCTGTRITRTIYLSCPTCGRTKFNLQETVRKVKEATGHLKGLKIAVMGCIVNGPGEMAGADYGYVGAAEGKVHIYRGTKPVLKNMPEEEAVDELLRLIKEDGQRDE